MPLVQLLRDPDIGGIIIHFSGTVQEVLCRGISTPSIFLSVEEQEYFHQWFLEWQEAETRRIDYENRRDRWLASWHRREERARCEELSRQEYFQRFVVRQEFWTLDDQLAKRAARRLHLRRFGIDLRHVYAPSPALTD